MPSPVSLYFGFGQRSREDDDFGHLDEECFEAGDDCGNFLDSMTKEHILYFWQLSDLNELMKQVLNVIVESSAADSDNFQATSDPHAWHLHETRYVCLRLRCCQNVHGTW
jgi:hypothetical protein